MKKVIKLVNFRYTAKAISVTNCPSFIVLKHDVLFIFFY